MKLLNAVRLADMPKEAAEHVAQQSLATTAVVAATPAKAEQKRLLKETPSREVRFTPASELVMRGVTWLWEDMHVGLGRVPLGKLGLLAGREGIGKSLFSLWIAAKITRGTLRGCHFGSPQNVAIAATEDDWEDTILPRLVAAKADLHRVFHVAVAVGHDETQIVLPFDVPALETLIREKEIIFVVLDPILSRLDAGIDTHKDSSSRRGLEPLASIAGRCRCTFLGIIHLNKGGSGDPLKSIMGSVAFPAASRFVLFCMVDPEDKAVRLVGLPKNNAGRCDLPTMAFTIEEAVLGRDADGQEIKTGKMVWKNDDPRAISDLVAEQAAALGSASSKKAGKQEAKIVELAVVLKNYLQEHGGRADSAEALEAMKDLGYYKNAVYKAVAALKVTSEKREGKKRDWVLPKGEGSTIDP